MTPPWEEDSVPQENHFIQIATRSQSMKVPAKKKVPKSEEKPQQISVENKVVEHQDEEEDIKIQDD